MNVVRLAEASCYDVVQIEEESFGHVRWRRTKKSIESRNG